MTDNNLNIIALPVKNYLQSVESWSKPAFRYLPASIQPWCGYYVAVVIIQFPINCLLIAYAGYKDSNSEKSFEWKNAFIQLVGYSLVIGGPAAFIYQRVKRSPNVPKPPIPVINLEDSVNEFVNSKEGEDRVNASKKILDALLSINFTNVPKTGDIRNLGTLISCKHTTDEQINGYLDEFERRDKSHHINALFQAFFREATIDAGNAELAQRVLRLVRPGVSVIINLMSKPVNDVFYQFLGEKLRKANYAIAATLINMLPAQDREGVLGKFPITSEALLDLVKSGAFENAHYSALHIVANFQCWDEYTEAIVDHLKVKHGNGWNDYLRSQAQAKYTPLYGAARNVLQMGAFDRLLSEIKEGELIHHQSPLMQSLFTLIVNNSNLEELAPRIELLFLKRGDLDKGLSPNEQFVLCNRLTSNLKLVKLPVKNAELEEKCRSFRSILEIIEKHTDKITIPEEFEALKELIEENKFEKAIKLINDFNTEPLDDFLNVDSD